MSHCLIKSPCFVLKPMGGVFLIFVLAALLAVSTESVAVEKNYEQRIVYLERLSKNQNLLEMLTQLQILQREVSSLRGEVELMAHNLGEIKKQQKNIYVDLDQRISGLDQRLTSGVGGAGSSVAGGGFVVPVGEQPDLGGEEGYQAALALLKVRRYEDAIEAFQVYLITYPSSDYAANAQYWMAEAYYVLKDYRAAISQFNKVISAYPGNRKVPDAYLKLGFSFYEIKDWKNARQMLEKVIVDFSGSTAARLAKLRLQKMKREGLG